MVSLVSSVLPRHLPYAALLLLACDSGPGTDKPGEGDTDADVDSDVDADSDADTDGPSAPDSGDDTGAPSYFQPYYVHLTAFFGYDPTANAARWYRSDDFVVPPNLVGMLFEATFAFTGDYAADACGFTIFDADTSSFLDGEPWSVPQAAGSADHLGFVMPVGTFLVGDYEDAATGMPSCRDLEFDPAQFGAGFPEWASNREWGFGVGPLDPALQATIETDSDLDELAALLAAGQLIGGSFQTSDTARNGSMLMVGYPMDAAGNIESEIYLSADEMWPAEQVPAQGVYTAFLLNWIRADEYFGTP